MLQTGSAGKGVIKEYAHNFPLEFFEDRMLTWGDSMKSGVRVLRDASIPNFSELEEAFDAVGKVLSQSASGLSNRAA